MKPFREAKTCWPKISLESSFAKFCQSVHHFWMPSLPFSSILNHIDRVSQIQGAGRHLSRRMDTAEESKSLDSIIARLEKVRHEMTWTRFCRILKMANQMRLKSGWILWKVLSATLSWLPFHPLRQGAHAHVGHGLAWLDVMAKKLPTRWGTRDVTRHNWTMVSR